jgi:L-aspartate oxidase
VIFAFLSIMSPMKTTDYLIIGTGISGLATALHLQNLGQVTLVTKGTVKRPDYDWNQDGLAAVLTKEDRFKKHIEDTLETGHHHNNRDSVRAMVEHGPKVMRFLESLGLSFKKEPYAEAGHSERRVWRTSDFTSQDIYDALLKAVQKSKAIEIFQGADAVELIVRNDRCDGAFFRTGEKTEIEPILAKQTILATGGLGRLFERSDNAHGCGGDGMALAANAGVELKDLEFVQFHPTALSTPIDARYFTLSETLRVFGAKIVDASGRSFLDQYDKRAELAPRDVLSRAIQLEKMNGQVFLDLRYFNPKEIKTNFPTVLKMLKEHGFDPAKALIPVTPVQHFSCGGIPVNLQGETKLTGLSAVGEAAFTGCHGANLVPGNALLESLVFAEAVGKAMERRHPLDRERKMDDQTPLNPPTIVIEDQAQVNAYAIRIAQILWERAGIVRTPENLRLALKEITEIPARDHRIQRRQIVAYKLIQACMARPESLGCHTLAEDIV